LAAGLIADRDAGQEVVGDLAIEAAGEAADRIGEGAGVVVAGDGAGVADRAAPGTPQSARGRIAGDVAGFSERDARSAAAARAVCEVRQEELGRRTLKCGKLLPRPDIRRAYWKDVDVGATLGEFNIVHLLASNAGRHV
jgi:hypothetical protein